MKNSQPYKYEPVFLNSKNGDKVWSSEFGDGVVTGFGNSENCIEVRFANTHTAFFTYDGLRTIYSLYPTLFLKKKRMHFPLYEPTPPHFPVDTFMYVSQDGKKWYPRYFCKWFKYARSPGYAVCTWADGRTSKTVGSPNHFVDFRYYRLESGETNFK